MADDKLRCSELRRKYKNTGFDSLSDKEIIELILSYSRTKNFEAKAADIIDRYGSVTAVIDAEKSVLEDTFDLNDSVLTFLGLIPCFSKIYTQSSEAITSLESTAKAKRFFENFFIGFNSEVFGIACTSDNFADISTKTLSKGMKFEVNISIREIVDFAFRNNSEHIFIAHTHPTGAAHPSANDIAVTDYIYNALKPFGIVLVDHIIVAKNSSLSMREIPIGMQFKKEKAGGYRINAK